MTIRRLALIGLLSAFIVLLSAPTGAVAQNNPAAAVETFLNRWAEKDYAAMYRLIHVHRIDDQPEFPESVFVARYERVDDVLNIIGLDYTVNDTQLQGQSAVVRYDVRIETASYGTIDDSDRVMRLVNVNGTWQIAWSTQDIFEGLTRDGEIRVTASQGRRATIYDRNGVPLAQDGGRTVGMLTARENMLSDRDCSMTLAEITMEPIPLIEARWANLNLDTRFFLAEMTEDAFNQNRTRLRENCGVNDGFTSQPHRVYLGGTAVVHVTGHVSPVQSGEEEARYGTGQLVGREGVENYFNDILAGQQDRVVRIVGPNGTTMRELGSAAGTPPTPVQLTIDADLQMIVARAMSDAFVYAVTNWANPGQSPGGAAVVLDVRNGDVLAMFSYPTYNPSMFNPSTVTPNEILVQTVNSQRRPTINRAVNEQYPTGSTFKLITAAAALNEGTIGLNDIFDCQYRWDGTPFGGTNSAMPDWRLATEGFPPTGPVTPAEALMASCNPFFYEQGALLFRQYGPNALADYGRRLGMLQTYFGGVLRETGGVIPAANSPDNAINEAIGQGDVAVPPIQMAVMTATIANGGTAYRPRLVLQVGGLDGTPVQEQFETQIISENDFNPGVIETIQEGMCGTTTNPDLGTAYGRFVHNPDSERSYVFTTAPYTSCGKTGTAETAGDPNAWYVAYAPADNPEIAVVVMVEQSLEGSQVAAPIVRRIFDDYFNAPREEFPWWWNNEPFNRLIRFSEEDAIGD